MRRRLWPMHGVRNNELPASTLLHSVAHATLSRIGRPRPISDLQQVGAIMICAPELSPAHDAAASSPVRAIVCEAGASVSERYLRITTFLVARGAKRPIDSGTFAPRPGSSREATQQPRKPR